MKVGLLIDVLKQFRRTTEIAAYTTGMNGVDAEITDMFGLFLVDPEDADALDIDSLLMIGGTLEEDSIYNIAGKRNLLANAASIMRRISDDDGGSKESDS